MGKTIHLVKCPTCAKTVKYTPDNPYRPFCSERCKLIDLGEWAAESFKFPGESVNPDDVPEDKNK